MERVRSGELAETVSSVASVVVVVGIGETGAMNLVSATASGYPASFDVWKVAR